MNGVGGAASAPKYSECPFKSGHRPLYHVIAEDEKPMLEAQWKALVNRLRAEIEAPLSLRYVRLQTVHRPFLKLGILAALFLMASLI